MKNNIGIIINFLMSGSVTIIGIVVGYYIGTKKYIFQKTYDQKLVCIIVLYKQIVNLEFILKEYIHFIGADTKKESIDKKNRIFK